MLPHASLPTLRITGTEINYYTLCQRKLWWYARGMEQEHVENGAGAENVALGALLHETSYPQQTRKDILVDNLLRLDFTDDGKVHEIKMSKGGERAAKLQLLYYLYYLKHAKGVETSGVLDFPQQRRTEAITLTPAGEREVEQAMEGVIRIREQSEPPPVPGPMPICRKCAYEDLCWG